jgi:hypothetical protein
MNGKSEETRNESIVKVAYDRTPKTCSGKLSGYNEHDEKVFEYPVSSTVVFDLLKYHVAEKFNMEIQTLNRAYAESY